MRLIGLAVILAVSLFAAPLTVEAQQAGRVPRIGALGGGEGADSSPGWTGFRQGLRELGWEEGRNIAVEFRFTGGRDERYRELAGELVRLNVDVLAASDSQAVRVAKEATGTIPIVMFAVGYPVETGLIESLARPGGNVTGMANQLGDLEGKSLEFLREIAPGMRRVAVVWHPNNPGSAMGQKSTESLAQRFGLHFISVPVRQPEGLERALTTLARERPDALHVHPLSLRDRTMIAEFALKHRLPSITGQRAGAEAGLLMSHGPNQFDQGRRAAQYVDKILKGAKPGDLPVQQPTKFEFVINLKTAKALGITVPHSLLLRADQVIE
jgi:putative tryptophan/tyrosine transport system substrate-binding protein